MYFSLLAVRFLTSLSGNDVGQSGHRVCKMTQSDVRCGEIYDVCRAVMIGGGTQSCFIWITLMYECVFGRGVSRYSGLFGDILLFISKM